MGAGKTTRLIFVAVANAVEKLHRNRSDAADGPFADSGLQILGDRLEPITLDLQRRALL
jgi:hypothetical protein